MSAGFTPGPWQMAGTHTARPQFFDVIDSDGRTKAYTLVTRVRREADAHLIAAAPELYGNAEFLCERLRDLEGYDGDELLRQLMGHVLPALARMEIALAKARGEQ